MKYTMKKTIAFLLTLVMLVNILPVSVLADQPAEGRRGPLNAPATRGADGNTEDFDVEVSFHDYDDNPIAAPSVTGNYYLIVMDTEDFSAATVANSSNDTYWNIVNLGNCAGTETPFTVSIPGLSNREYEAYSNNPDHLVGTAYNDLPDDIKSNLKVRLVHTTEDLNDLGKLKGLARHQVEKYNTIMNQSFIGYDPLGTNGPVSDGAVDYRTGFKQGNTKELDVVIEFDPAEDAEVIQAGEYYVVLEATSADGNNKYYKTVDLATDGSVKTIIKLEGDWSDGQQYSPNWQSVTAKIIKAKNHIDPGPNKPNENDYYDVAYVKNNKYTYSYVLETDNENHILHMEHKFTLSDYPLEDALDPLWVLGPGVNYGVTAQTFNQVGHMQTNLATNNYICHGGYDVNITPDLGNTTGSIVAGSIDDVMHLVLKEADKLVLFINEDDIDKIDGSVQNTIVVKSSTEKIAQSIVNPILNHGEAMSGILAQKEATYKPTSQTFDLTVFDDGKTIYIDPTNLNLSSGVEIKMHPNQTIVFNVPGDNVTVGQIKYYYSNGMNWSDAKDHVASHTVFNMPNATTVTLNEAIGMFLIPQAASKTTITQSSEGWIITGGEVTSAEQSNEWHCRNQSLTLSVDADAQFGKKVNGASPAAKEVFEFELFQWDENESNDTSDEHWTKVATLTNSGPSMTYSVLYNNGQGGRVFKIREKGKASTTKGTYICDQNEYYITIVYMGASGVVYAAFPEYYDNVEYAIAKFRSNDISGTPESSHFMGVVDATNDENAISAITFNNIRQPDNITVNKVWVYAAENSAITGDNRVTLENGTQWPAGTTVTVQLQKQVGEGEIVDVEGKSAILSSDQPSHTFTGLVQYEGDDEITYSVKEDKIEGTYAENFGLEKIEQQSDGSFLITNKEKTAELTLTKTVTVNNGNNGTLADMDIQFVVKDEDNHTVATVTMEYPSDFTDGSKSVTLTQANGILPGKTYTVEETATSVQQAGYTRITTVSSVETQYEDETVNPSGDIEINTETNSGEIAFRNAYTRNTGEETVHDSVTVNKLDGDGEALNGAVFTLYKEDGTTKIKDSDLASYLPTTNNGSITLKLKETTAPEDYKAISTVWDVVISTKIEEVLKNNKFVTVTTYTMTIAGNDYIDVVNVHKTGDLTVSKTVVSDAAADKNQKFQFTIKLSDTAIGGEDGKTYGDLTFKNGISTFELTGGENKKAIGLPTGVTYTVTEAVDQNFEQDKAEAKGTISETGSSAAFTNTRKVGDLVVSKTVVSDAAADKDQKFLFTITLSDTTIGGDEGKTYGDLTFKNGIATIELKGGEKAKAEGLLYSHGSC